jgi:hypothetical protein
LIKWRNMIAHQDFTKLDSGEKSHLTLQRVRQWRSVCGKLARSFDDVMRVHLQSLTGSLPWSK